MTDFNMPPGVSARDIPGQDEAPDLVDQLQAAASRASWPEDADLMTEAGAEIARLRSQVTTATNLIGAGLDLMTDEQVGQWAGVRTFLEQDTSDYLPIGEVIAERDRLRAEVEALREDAAKCRAELLAIHEIASCGWSNVLQHPIAPADTLTVRDVKIMAIELLKGHQTAEPRVHG